MTRSAFNEAVTVALIRYGGNDESGVRSEAHNAHPDVGGHPDSLHRSGLARDAWFHTIEDMIACARHLLRQGVWVKRNGERTIHAQALVPLGLSLDVQLTMVDGWATSLGEETRT